MNIDEIVSIEMLSYSNGAYADHGSAKDSLLRFANSISIAEREECALIADFAERWIGDWKAKYGNASIAEAIRMQPIVGDDTTPT